MRTTLCFLRHAIFICMLLLSYQVISQTTLAIDNLDSNVDDSTVTSRIYNNTLDRSFVSQGALTIGIAEIDETNSNSQKTYLKDGAYLVLDNYDALLDITNAPTTVNLSSDINPAVTTNVSLNLVDRAWKITEFNDIPNVEVQILKSALQASTTETGQYLMLISNTPLLDSTLDSVIMSETTNELGEKILTTNYDFDGIKYISFAWAQEFDYERSIYLNGSTDFIDIGNNLDLNPTGFTLSAWINRDFTDAGNSSIVSKRSSSFSEGFELSLDNDDKVKMQWKNTTIQSITSHTSIPDGEWHQVAITYNGTHVSIYIDGVLDSTQPRIIPIATPHSFLIGASGTTTKINFFKGYIDEVRVWDTALTVDQLRYMMNQEIEENQLFVSGSYFYNRGISPTKAVTNNITWSKLAGYYPMSSYTYTNTKDESGNGNHGALGTIRSVDKQTAPLPYKSTVHGDWHNKTTWENGDLQTIPGTTSIVNNNISIDWNIVRTNTNVTIIDAADLPLSNNDNRTLLALFVDASTLTVAGDNSLHTGTGLTVSHYLNLDGDIDLNGESQLIQTIGSDLEVQSSGKLDKDQQGTKDLYTYGYWSSPVGNLSTTNNNTNFKIKDVLKDGTTVDNLKAISFLTAGYDGNTDGDNIAIADFWIWKYNNLSNDDYASWQHVRSTSTIEPGEGYTMKGVENTDGDLSLEQNYVFSGKPNNGIIELDIDSGNDYLTGNPFSSALDAHKFLQDNGPNATGNSENPVINGTLYFWEHWANGSHNLSDYQGSYATYNFSGGVSAATIDEAINQSGSTLATKTPSQYIPVSQGFFVVGTLDDSTLKFNNGQRVFKKEAAGSSVFFEANDTTATVDNTQTNNTSVRNAQNEDLRSKIRLAYNSINTYKRQLLITADSNASMEYDWGYDGQLNEDHRDDMFWIIEDEKYVIQGINEFNNQTVLPIGIITATEGLNTISINNLENFDINTNIFLHDKELNIFHDLKDSKYDVILDAGEHLERFEITFTIEDSLSIGTNTLNLFDVNYTNAIESIVISNPNHETITSVKLISILGQEVFTTNKISAKSKITLKVSDLSSGTYIIKIKTKDRKSITKKVLIK